MAIITNGTYSFPVDIYIETCCACGMAFGMPKEFHDKMYARRSLHNGDFRKSFTCPAGHAQHYTGTSDLQKARNRADIAEADADHQRRQRQVTERRLMTTKQQHGKTKAKLRRMQQDTCPECGEQFERSALTAHLAAVHQVEDLATAAAKPAVPA